MIITKLGHSCVLAKSDDVVALFDPGDLADKNLTDGLNLLNVIIYTHSHPDHFDVDVLRSLVKKFPGVIVNCNDDVKAIIVEAGVVVKVTEESAGVKKFVSPHEKAPWPGVKNPKANGYHFLNTFSHPGDSHSFYESKKVLAMPFVAGWGKIGDAIDKVIELKPQFVLPIHDWRYTKEARHILDDQLATSLGKHDIKVLSSEPGIVHEI